MQRNASQANRMQRFVVALSFRRRLMSLRRRFTVDSSFRRRLIVS
jgi:hypothetical protein